MPSPDDRITPSLSQRQVSSPLAGRQRRQQQPPPPPPSASSSQDILHPPRAQRRSFRWGGMVGRLLTPVILLGMLGYGGWRVAADETLQATSWRIAGVGMASMAYFADLALGYDAPQDGKIGPVSQAPRPVPLMPDPLIGWVPAKNLRRE